MVDTQSHLQVSVDRCMFYPSAAFHRLYIDGFFSPCLEMGGRISDSSSVFIIVEWTTLQETNISPKDAILKMIFLFPRWDMLIPWRVSVKIDHPRWDPKLVHVHPTTEGEQPNDAPLQVKAFKNAEDPCHSAFPITGWDPGRQRLEGSESGGISVEKRFVIADGWKI